MSSQYAVHSVTNKTYHVNFRNFPADETAHQFATFEIAHDNNTYILYLSSQKQHNSFIKSLAQAIAKELENPAYPIQEEDNAE